MTFANVLNDGIALDYLHADGQECWAPNFVPWLARESWFANSIQLVHLDYLEIVFRL